MLRGALSPTLPSISLLPPPHCSFPCAGGNPSSCLTAVDEVRHYVTGSERQPDNQHSPLLACSQAMKMAVRGKQAGKGHIQYSWSFCSINSPPALLHYSRQHLVNGCVENICLQSSNPASFTPAPRPPPPNKEVEHEVQYTCRLSRNSHCFSNQIIYVEVSWQMWEWISSEYLIKSVKCLS